HRALSLGARLELDRGLRDVPADPGDDPDRGRSDRGLDALRPAPVRGHLLPGARRVAIRAGCASGQLLPAPAAPARLGRGQRQLPSRPPPEREDPELPPTRGTRGARDVPANAGDHTSQQHRDVPAEALGYREPATGAVPEAKPA